MVPDVILSVIPEVPVCSVLTRKDHYLSGMGLNDSPMGLAGYILEKFSTWTNRDWRELVDGGLTK